MVPGGIRSHDRTWRLTSLQNHIILLAHPIGKVARSLPECETKWVRKHLYLLIRKYMSW